jgi:VanZ family protein
LEKNEVFKMKQRAVAKTRPWTIERAGLVFWALLLVALILAALVPKSGTSFGDTLYLDKIFHFTTKIAATMLPLICIARRRPAIMIAALMPVLGFGLEYLQRGISGRTFSPEDLIANNLGVLFGVAVGCAFRLYRRYKREGEKK